MYSDLGYKSPVADVDFHPHDHSLAFCSFSEHHPVLIYKYDYKGKNFLSLMNAVGRDNFPLFHYSCHRRSFENSSSQNKTSLTLRATQACTPGVEDAWCCEKDSHWSLGALRD